MNNLEIDETVKAAEAIAAGDYKQHEPTIRSLDAKNAKLQRSVALLSVVATLASIIALFK